MRKLPLLPILALLALLVFAAPASALTLPEILAAQASEEAEESEPGELEDEAEEGESAGEEACELGDEEACEEVEAEEAEECVLEDATARVSPQAGNDTVALVVRYTSFAPAPVAIDARLRGSHGHLHLGAEHAHFRRAGVFRDTFVLSEKEMERALSAREFEVELQALNTPRYCRLELNGAPHRAKRSLRAGAPGRSGDQARTRGRSRQVHPR
jgi:hypothetical protein